jgi:hypothetical protein
MAVAPKSELYRLIEVIPDTQPELATVLTELGLRLLVASQSNELLYDRLVRELAGVQAMADDADGLSDGVKTLRDHWLRESDADDDPLLRMLESAPPDDEPLTPEEVAMLDARHPGGRLRSSISHDELGRLLRS